jgi:predicted transcriptional regulator
LVIRYHGLTLNPKLLRDHLNYLIRYEIVNKEDKIYQLTKLGKELCELNFFINLKDIEEQMGTLSETSLRN